MKIKHKGKIYPSPSSSSSSSASLSSPCSRDVLSVMKLLPAAILALASVLSLEDRDVLAYMIMRSLNSSNMSSLSSENSKGSKRSSKKQPSGGGGAAGGVGGGTHKPPVFGCDCFDCYTSYWLRWDSSPNRELIHQVIEAFEEHLTTGEASSRRTGRGKRRDKPGLRVAAQPDPALPPPPHPPASAQPGDSAPDQNCLLESDAVSISTAVDELRAVVVSTENEAAVPVTSPEEEVEVEPAAAPEATEGMGRGGSPELGVVAVAGSTGGSHHKGLARKVLPDVLGLLNSRLWNLWGPNV
ncbi:hypothetical protein CRG98_002480 [Punica granatum]|uniref:Uncharacterized protein n=1 Tax=Punica granatum TaxID=22663 RepID=A0A2I0L8F2_PUNGR|nr:hypothetical protein CRG98_002480 [Punica granatum]